MKSKDLFENCEYKGEYSDFRSHLSRYVKRGYVEKCGTRPSYYRLTDLGREVCIENPLGYRVHRIKLHEEIVKNYDERMKKKYGGDGVIHVDGGGSAGLTVVNSNQYSDNDFGGSRDAKIEEMRENIEDDGFLQSVDEYKVKELIKLGDADLLTDFYMNLTDYHKRHQTVMNLNPNNIPTGKTNEKKMFPNYFPEMFNNFGKDVTEELYSTIPYRFYSHKATGKTRLSGRNEAGNYTNNDDGEVIEFNKVLRNIFSGNMKIDGVRTVENGEEIIKVYYRNSQIKYHVLNCSMDVSSSN